MSKILSEEISSDSILLKNLELVDRMTFLGFIPYTFTYHATMEARPDEGTIAFAVKSPMWVQLTHDIVLKQEESNVILKDTVKVCMRVCVCVIPLMRDPLSELSGSHDC